MYVGEEAGITRQIFAYQHVTSYPLLQWSSRHVLCAIFSDPRHQCPTGCYSTIYSARTKLPPVALQHRTRWVAHRREMGKKVVWFPCCLWGSGTIFHNAIFLAVKGFQRFESTELSSAEKACDVAPRQRFLFMEIMDKKVCVYEWKLGYNNLVVWSLAQQCWKWVFLSSWCCTLTIGPWT